MVTPENLASKLYNLGFFLFHGKVLLNYSNFERSTLVGQRNSTLVLWNHSRPSVCLSVCPSVIKFSQDWIISFFWYCTWWYLVTEKARFLIEKKIYGPNLGLTGLNQAHNEFFLPFLKFGLVFLEIACNDSLPQCLTSSRDKTLEKNFRGPNLSQTSQNRSQN